MTHMIIMMSTIPSEKVTSLTIGDMFAKCLGPNVVMIKETTVWKQEVNNCLSSHSLTYLLSLCFDSLPIQHLKNSTPYQHELQQMVYSPREEFAVHKSWLFSLLSAQFSLPWGASQSFHSAVVLGGAWTDMCYICDRWCRPLFFLTCHKRGFSRA